MRRSLQCHCVLAVWPFILISCSFMMRGMEGKVYLLELVLLGLLVLAGFCCLAVELLRCELFMLISLFLSRVCIAQDRVR